MSDTAMAILAVGFAIIFMAYTGSIDFGEEVDRCTGLTVAECDEVRAREREDAANRATAEAERGALDRARKEAKQADQHAFVPWFLVGALMVAASWVLVLALVDRSSFALAAGVTLRRIASEPLGFEALRFLLPAIAVYLAGSGMKWDTAFTLAIALAFPTFVGLTVWTGRMMVSRFNGRRTKGVT